MMLSIVFLLMYVASSLRAGSAGFQQQQENKKLRQKAAGLEQQIKVYNTLKDEALKKQTERGGAASLHEADGQAHAPQGGRARREARPSAKAKENEDKEFALNQYQQLVKNIISANILAKTQIQHRDQLIVTKDATIEEKKQKIAEMEEIVAQNEPADQNHQLAARRRRSRPCARSRAAPSRPNSHGRKITAMRNESEAQVQALEAKKASISQELTQVESTLQDTTAKLDDAHTTIQAQDQTITQKEQAIAQQEQEKAQLAAKLEADKRAMPASSPISRPSMISSWPTSARLHGQFEEAEAHGRCPRRKIAKFAATAEAKAGPARRAAFRPPKQDHRDGQPAQGRPSRVRGRQAEARGHATSVAGTQQALAGTRQSLAGTQQDLAGTKQALAGTKQALAGTQQDACRNQASTGTEPNKHWLAQNKRWMELKQALANTEAAKSPAPWPRSPTSRRSGQDPRHRQRAQSLAKQIADQFAKAGIKGAVDGKTGEVTLDFGGEYFDTGSTDAQTQDAHDPRQVHPALRQEPVQRSQDRRQDRATSRSWVSPRPPTRDDTSIPRARSARTRRRSNTI